MIGVGLSPRGNDNPNAKSNVSRSPVRFMHELGQAYRASGRTKPLMDELAFHPYPVKNTDPPFVGYAWPNAGLANLDRIKQAVWDAFHGTAQPTFAETGVQSFTPPLKLELDEIGWQVAVMPGLASLYSGTETVPTIDEATQAGYYGDAITAAECDPTVSSLSFFLLLDEPMLSRWQSGLERIDGSHRPSYDHGQAGDRGHRRQLPRQPRRLDARSGDRRAAGDLRRPEAQAHDAEHEVELHRGREGGGRLPGGDLPGRDDEAHDRLAPRPQQPEGAPARRPG